LVLVLHGRWVTSSVPTTEFASLSRRRLLSAGATIAAGLLIGSPASAAEAERDAPDNLGDLNRSLPEPGDSDRAAGWGGHANGRIPASSLLRVPAAVGQPYLRTDAALAYTAVSSAFAQTFGFGLPITEAYRDFARQQALWDRYHQGGNLAAPPGTSVHGWALACDFGGGVASYGTPQKTWMNAHGPTFGWRPRGDSFSQREAWHFEYDGSYQPPALTPPRPKEDSPMYVVRNSGTGHSFVVARHYVRHLGSAADVTLMSKVLSAADEVHSLSGAQLQTVFVALGIPRQYTSPTKLPHGGAGGWWSLEDAIHTRSGGSLGV
jgi:hypothetical protein